MVLKKLNSFKKRAVFIVYIMFMAVGNGGGEFGNVG
jgi:hypothetical protein